MTPAVSDRHYGTQFVKTKLNQYKENVESPDKTGVKLDLGPVAMLTVETLP